MAQPERKPDAAPVFEGHSAVLLRMVAGSTPTQLNVEVPGLDAPVTARTTLQVDASTVERAVLLGQLALVLFEGGDPSLPIVIGLIQPQPSASTLQELLLMRATSGAGPSHAPPTEARLDGRRVVLEGKDEVVLRCGDASITLRRDGKVLLKGAYIETNSRGVNRIKGGSVKIN